MTKIKLCGITKLEDIKAINNLNPDYVGFVFFEKSVRFVTAEKAKLLRQSLKQSISAVGVFVNEQPQIVAQLLNSGVINMPQLHGEENEEYIKELRKLTNKPIIQAFKIESEKDIEKAEKSTADYILLDSGAGSGSAFNWQLMQKIKRPYFLAGGLDCNNVAQAIKEHHPFAVDVSSGIETQKAKDKSKMTQFVATVRKENLV